MNDIRIKLQVDAETNKATAELDELKAAETRVKKEYDAIAASAKKASNEQVKGANNAEKAVKDTEKSLGKLHGVLNSVGAAVAGAFAVEAIIQFGRQSVEAFADAELGAKRLEFAVKNLAGSSGFEKLNSEAEKLMESSIFDDDAIKAAQTELVKYGLSVDEVSKLMPRLVDAASVSGKSLDELISISVSAFEGRVIGVQKELGIALDKNATKTEMINQLYQGLAKYAGGASDALGTTAGKMQSLSNAFGEFTEGVGEALVSIPSKIAGIGDAISDFLLKNLNAEEYARQEQIKRDKEANDKRLEEQRQFNQKRQRQFERDYEDGLVMYKKYSTKQLQAELESLQSAEKLSKGMSGYRGYIQALQELIELKSKEEKAHTKTIKTAHEPQIGAYAKLSQAISTLNTQMMDYITENGAASMAIQNQLDKLKAQKKAVDDLAVGLKSIETTLEEISETDPGLNLKPIEEKKDAALKKEQERANLQRQIQEESFNLAFQLNNYLTETEIQNAQRVADAQIAAAEQVMNERLAQDGITKEKQLEYQRNFEAQRQVILKAQFEREKQLRKRQAFIDGALAIVRTFASYGGFTPPAIVAAAAQAAATAVQIATIDAQKYEKGGWIDGKRHREGGTIIEAEKDEFVVNRNDAMRNSELLEAINKGRGQEYIMNKYVMPAVIKKSMAEAQSSNLAENIAEALKYQMFDDHALRKTIKETSRQSASYIVEGLKRNQKPTRYV